VQRRVAPGKKQFAELYAHFLSVGCREFVAVKLTEERKAQGLTNISLRDRREMKTRLRVQANGGEEAMRMS